MNTNKISKTELTALIQKHLVSGGAYWPNEVPDEASLNVCKFAAALYGIDKFNEIAYALCDMNKAGLSKKEAEAKYLTELTELSECLEGCEGWLGQEIEIKDKEVHACIAQAVINTIF